MKGRRLSEFKLYAGSDYSKMTLNRLKWKDEDDFSLSYEIFKISKRILWSYNEHLKVMKEAYGQTKLFLMEY